MWCDKLAPKLVIAILIGLLWTAVPVAAAPPDGEQYLGETEFIYLVQPNDTLIKIALRYNLKLAEIVLANGLSNPNLIFPGQQLILPGVLPAPPPEPVAPAIEADQLHTIQMGETLYKVASQYGVSIGAIVLANNLLDPDVVQVGQTLTIPGGPPSAPEVLPAPFVAIDLSEPVVIQGRSLVIKVTLADVGPVALSGRFEEIPLFFDQVAGYHWTIIPIHALAEPNVYPIRLSAVLADGTTVTTFQNVTVIEGPYGQENIHLDESRQQLLDAALIQAEREKLTSLWSRISPQPRWAGPFSYPVARSTLRITSYFGTRRSYNDSEALSFHGGTDFGGGVGTPIYAPAAGRVVLAEPLTVRGNAVLIDHGLGLFSGYWHQSRLAVIEGQEVQAGDLIGYIGNSGLVTGPHLHWELRLNGIAVEPLQWVQQSIP